MCAVSMPYLNFRGCLGCVILSNEHRVSPFYVAYCPIFGKLKSDHLWMSYIPSQAFSENQIAVLGQIDENGFLQMGVRFGWDTPNTCFHQVGFRVEYEQDMEDIREMLSTQSSNNTCNTPYKGLDVHHNSTEGIKLKRSCDEYEGAGASGEGSSNDVPHLKRIER